MFERESTNRRAEPDDVFILTKYLTDNKKEELASSSLLERETSEANDQSPSLISAVAPTIASIDQDLKERLRGVAPPLSSIIGHLVYGRVISQEDAERVSPGFAAYLNILARTERNAYDRDLGDGVISRIYFFGKVLASTPLTSKAISLSSALRLPDEEWREAVENAWALIPEAYKLKNVFKGPDIMLLITNMTAGA